MMDRKTLEQKLLCYRSDRARAEYLRRYIPLMEKRLSELKEEALQGIGRALPPDAVRVSCGPGDPTGRLAVRAAEDALTEEMRLCRDQLNGLRREAAALDAHLSLMECLLASLTEESRFLLTDRQNVDLPSEDHQRNTSGKDHNECKQYIRALDSCQASHQPVGYFRQLISLVGHKFDKTRSRLCKRTHHQSGKDQSDSLVAPRPASYYIYEYDRPQTQYERHHCDHPVIHSEYYRERSAKRSPARGSEKIRSGHRVFKYSLIYTSGTRKRSSDNTCSKYTWYSDCPQNMFLLVCPEFFYIRKLRDYNTPQLSRCNREFSEEN